MKQRSSFALFKCKQHLFQCWQFDWWYLLSLAQLKGRRIVRGRDKVFYSNFVDWGGGGGKGGLGHSHLNKLKQGWFSDDFRGNNGMHSRIQIGWSKILKNILSGRVRKCLFWWGEGFCHGARRRRKCAIVLRSSRKGRRRSNFHGKSSDKLINVFNILMFWITFEWDYQYSLLVVLYKQVFLLLLWERTCRKSTKHCPNNQKRQQ